MMRADDLKPASEKTLDYIISQAEQRLEGQNAFATAADQRSAMVTAVAAALSAAAVGVFGQTYATVGLDPVTIAAAVAAVGFSISTHFALESAKCVDFHPAGFRPRDFVSDVQFERGETYTKRAIAEDYDERIQFNSDVLAQRGRNIRLSISTMVSTPIICGAVLVLMAGSEALSKSRFCDPVQIGNGLESNPICGWAGIHPERSED